MESLSPGVRQTPTCHLVQDILPLRVSSGMVNSAKREGCWEGKIICLPCIYTVPGTGEVLYYHVTIEEERG